MIREFLPLLTIFVVSVSHPGSADLAFAADGPRFYRALNLNGPALTIDGQLWEGGDAPHLLCSASAFEAPNVPLKPKTDVGRAKMIRSSRWGQQFSLEVQNVPDGVYQVFAYVWEDNNGEKYSITLNGRTVVRNHFSGVAGTWKRLGPWRVTLSNETLKIASSGGAANFSGIELWAGDGEVPAPEMVRFESSPTPEQIMFFESRIRPVLVDHCYGCHSQESDDPGGNLLLDSLPAIVKGGYTEPPVLPGDPDNSLLMRAVSHRDPDLKMPPDSRLTDDQIADLAEWIRMRAPDPRLENTVSAARERAEIDWEKARSFWSLRPLIRPDLPTVRKPDWPATDIDYFIQARAEASGLPLAADADRRTLIRRATFDLTGLPPSPEEIDSFVKDPADDAYRRLIDRLLDSPRYGERWGRYWLDVVRYSDTAGDNSDFPIPQMYLYRNWVIDAFNQDLPYDQFVREQLAGDLLGGTTESEKRARIIATGYIANSRRFGSRVSDYPQHLTIEDTIDNLGRTFLATSINCARCHDHKFDPIPTEEYYSLYGIFHSTRYPWPGIELEQRQRDFVTLIDPADASRLKSEREKRRKELDDTVAQLTKKRDAAKDEVRETLDAELREAQQAARDFSTTPLPYETFYAVADSDLIEDVPVHIKGDPAKSGESAPRGFLRMLSGQRLPQDDLSSGRLQLANWIVDPANPLTARVMANRIWLHHFGKAIVPTPNDFGRQGKPPTHPDLLDWLAFRFIESGWSVKSLHRTIMLSRVYRMQSQMSDVARETDPANDLLTAFPRRRLDAEAIRDTMLLLAGNLDLTQGGEHPFPPQDTWKFTQHNPFKALYETNRRSVYLMTQRIQRHPYLAIFDGADPSTSTPVRLTSTTPLQALYLLNDKFVHDQAAGLAKRITDGSEDNAARVLNVWQLMFGRTPEPDETAAALDFLNSARTEVEAPDPDLSAWQSLVRSLLRLNEFVYID